MNKHILNIVIFLLLITGCTANKFLTEDEKYYGGAEIKFEPNKNIEDRRDVKSDLNQLLTPQPNGKFIGSRPGVWFYEVAGEVKKDKGFKHWLKYKIGKEPVKMKDVDEATTSRQLKSSLRNNGYFGAQVYPEIREGKHENKVWYRAKISKPYHYDTIIYDLSDSVVQQRILSSRTSSKIKEGDRYDLGTLKQERQRIEKYLKDLGFYYFDNDYLLFRADSTVGNKQVKMYLKLKNTTPEDAYKVYKINKINIHAEQGGWSDEENKRDTLRLGNINYIYKTKAFRPEVLIEHVALQPGGIYRKEDELITLNRLIQLDVFRYVNVEFKPAENADQSLNANVFLTANKKKSLRLELQAVSKSNNFVGPNLMASFKNRNIFRGAESYELNLDLGYEVQVGGNSADNQTLNSYTIGIENVLTIPRIISPLNIRSTSSRYVPETKFKLGFRTLQRVNFFRLNSIDAAYGFNWRETDKKRHEFYPVDINFIQLAQVSSEFDSVLVNNPLLRRSYEEQFILGTTYSYFYNTQNDDDRRVRNDFYFNGNVDISGNLMHLAQSSIRSEENTDENPYTLFGSPYSQFVKADIDLRYYLDVGERSRIATRFIGGIGYAFGNSSTLPYTKQFAIGGSTSLRAFRPRSVGPGSFTAPESISFVDQTADIKLEFNAEYRFPIAGSFRGAFFTDVGNIWTIRTDAKRPGAQFDPARFMSQLAMGAGFGLRFDAEFFVIRLDLATPVRVPSNEEGSRWVLSDVAVNDKEWRRQNLV
ncbi:MAG: BamA/TamA family outer membrane protein, partial [Fulvivirga sp.]|nr:BamA/TamA family outer membrane protein [Fulvivirga sp.]